ncbi:hypothetical protein NQ317_015515 [Molorchus minor]|uniref:Uncharacterized protein n=1 Tax=Molorchus minor TaxID=1323400 RepID=A0ABQ9JLM5_9CUCU|nr:hypothetical protein NQ317_015515 [Molorchus minor]
MVEQPEIGRELREHNEKIVQCLLLLNEQRNELAFLIEKQYEERKKLEMEMERITYKLCLINKSLSQRIRTKNNYDKTLMEIEVKYNELVKTSENLLVVVQKEFNELDSTINKKTSTGSTVIVDDKGSCSPVSEKECQCDTLKETKVEKPTVTMTDTKIDVELPTKLEKSPEARTNGSSKEKDSDEDNHQMANNAGSDEDLNLELNFKEYS